MNLNQFFEQGQERWRKLEALVQRSSRGVSSLSEQELDELGRLYRQATSDLALAQRDFPGQRITLYLNQLVARSHTVIYRSEPMQWRRVRVFFAQRFPQLYRQLLPYTIVAFLLFLLPAIVAFIVVWRDTETIQVLLGAGIAELVETVEQGELWTDIAPSVRSTASTAILTNNIQVMFLTFAGGITGGLLTVWVLISNGLQLGGIFGLLQVYGLSAGLAEFIVAHGVIELSVIFLAGGSGLYVGDGLLRPGLESRREVLVTRGRTAVQVVIGCVPLLIFAGLIEGFISPSALPAWVKLMVGIMTGVGLYYYWLRMGRDSD